jgi:hypothetical protein
LERFLITFIMPTIRFFVSFTIHQLFLKIIFIIGCNFYRCCAFTCVWMLFQGSLLPAHDNRRTNSDKRGSVSSYDLFAKTLEGVNFRLKKKIFVLGITSFTSLTAEAGPNVTLSIQKQQLSEKRKPAKNFVPFLYASISYVISLNYVSSSIKHWECLQKSNQLRYPECHPLNDNTDNQCQIFSFSVQSDNFYRNKQYSH